MMYHSCSIGERPGYLAGQSNTLTPYSVCWVITGYEGVRYSVGKHPLNDVYKWQHNNLNRWTVALNLALNSKVKALAETSETNEEEKNHNTGGNSPFETNMDKHENSLMTNSRNKFAKVEQEATDLSGLLFEEEAVQACRQQKRKIIFGERKKKCCVTNALDGTVDSSVWKNGSAGINSKVSCDELYDTYG
ncbi:hypothetical protein TNCV_3230341 [Trichonephila clavipes]|nr:hypothetical protein TNCV_3230341 [Trichonephila clavipes]